MLLAQEQAESRLQSEANIVTRFAKGPSSLKIIPKTYQANGKRLPSFVKTQIAIMTRSGAQSSKEAALEADCSPQQVNNIKRGEHSNIDEPAVEKALGEVRDKALDRLMASMNLISDEKLEKCDAVKLSVISSNMGRIVEKTLPRQQEGSNVNLIVYAPQLKDESRYKVVDV